MCFIIYKDFIHTPFRYRQAPFSNILFSLMVDPLIQVETNKIILCTHFKTFHHLIHIFLSDSTSIVPDNFT